MPAALLSLHYLPSVSWFKNYLNYTDIWIEKHENFVKASGRNRCAITGANGRQMLTIPLTGGRDHHRKYTDTKIAYQTDWQKAHWHSIKSAYGSAPYFEFYEHIFQKFYEKQPVFLFDFNLGILQAVLSVLKITQQFECTTGYQKAITDMADLRNDRKGAAAIELLPRYYQVFEERNGFMPDLSIIDLVFHLGPRSADYLTRS